MKQVFLAIIFACIIITGCNTIRTTERVIIEHDTTFVEHVSIDTIKVIDGRKVDSLEILLKECRDSVKFYRDSVYLVNYMDARRIEKTKYYIRICEKDANQKKYFFGWIKRTMSDN